MLLITSNKAKQILYMRFVGTVGLPEIQRERSEAMALLTDLAGGFTLLVDFSELETMDRDCAPEIGRMMEVIGNAGVARIVRVIPDPSKDIGMNILAIFHYHQHPRTATCATMADALRQLSF